MNSDPHRDTSLDFSKTENRVIYIRDPQEEYEQISHQGL